MMKKTLSIMIVTLLMACGSEESMLDENILADYIRLNSDLQSSDLVACAASRENELTTLEKVTTDVFFYPIAEASDFRYFEADDLADSANFAMYRAIDLTSEPVFNGYLRKFIHPPFEGEKMGIVTYKTPGKIHVCNPIRLKTNTKPTEVNSQVVQIENASTTPSFAWEVGNIDENVIYFHVISDEDDNLISGTYTTERKFTFYDLSNVVFNITDTAAEPALEADQTYTFTLMGVSEDNWVNLLAELDFETKR